MNVKIKQHVPNVVPLPTVQGGITVRASGRKSDTKRASRIIVNAVEGKRVPNVVTGNVMDELKRLLVKHGLTLDTIISTYKKIINVPIVNTKPSDVLKALSRVERLHGIKEKDDGQPLGTIPPALASAMKDGNIEEYVIKITRKTKQYLDKAKRVNAREGEIVE